ncbi:7-carboxy-7-deazaguanine synthase [Iodidimonas muriae]|uniref:7-carboxy-7-deazaguanine synthase n=1 Tax=Iodidimonas muriae TaxID=261467 RepID=A0ABQ2LEN8_9PROT|nr:7-carboxy-7-deazaguanine synthase [Iodidimonas muriae]GER07566.1 7-carboxy-7-deazaguanine synthase [Kordiimonadales bacterium JCM 17843]GGO13903.1 7-carboxy-7-deazaguanine synthase [Iodidimonas muriae]
MTYSVKEIFYTLQGEGANSGRAAVFCRFSGCNLWTGREKDRTNAICQFCDTDFVGTDGSGGGKFKTAQDLADAVAKIWPHQEQPNVRPLVVCTGGEPLLQLDALLIDALHQAGFEIAVETNGTQAAPEGLDWICVSPKVGAELVLQSGDELKLVYPQKGGEPERYAALAFTHFFLQPMDSPHREANTNAAVDYCMRHPQWRLCLQTHKYVGID